MTMIIFIIQGILLKQCLSLIMMLTDQKDTNTPSHRLQMIALPTICHLKIRIPVLVAVILAVAEPQKVTATQAVAVMIQAPPTQVAATIQAQVIQEAVIPTKIWKTYLSQSSQ